MNLKAVLADFPMFKYLVLILEFTINKIFNLISIFNRLQYFFIL